MSNLCLCCKEILKDELYSQYCIIIAGDIQTQLDSKHSSTLLGAVSSITDTDLTTDRVLISTGGKVGLGAGAMAGPAWLGGHHLTGRPSGSQETKDTIYGNLGNEDFMGKLKLLWQYMTGDMGSIQQTLSKPLAPVQKNIDL